MGWDGDSGMRWVALRRDAIGWDGCDGLDAMRWDEMKWDGVGCHRFCREDGEGKGGGRG